jgi:hypothetical protein
VTPEQSIFSVNSRNSLVCDDTKRRFEVYHPRERMVHTTRRQITEAKDEGVVLDDSALSRNSLLVSALQANPKVV